MRPVGLTLMRKRTRAETQEIRRPCRWNMLFRSSPSSSSCRLRRLLIVSVVVSVSVVSVVYVVSSSSPSIVVSVVPRLLSSTYPGSLQSRPSSPSSVFCSTQGTIQSSPLSPSCLFALHLSLYNPPRPLSSVPPHSTSLTQYESDTSPTSWVLIGLVRHLYDQLGASLTVISI